MEMVKFCLGQRLDMLIKPMLYSHSEKLKNVEICKMTRGFLITSNPSRFSCIYSTRFTKHLLCARLCPTHWGLEPHAAPSLTPLELTDGSGSSPSRPWWPLSWRKVNGGTTRGKRLCLGCWERFLEDDMPQGEWL